MLFVELFIMESKRKRIFKKLKSKYSLKLTSLKSPEISTHPIIETHNGSVEGRSIRIGKTKKFANVFLGIPYARPPIGELRFRKPELLEGKWEGVLKAKHYANRSIQKDFIWDKLSEWLVGKSEDCLYLNIIAPAASPENNRFPNGYAVMFYIHGGGFVMDSAAKYHYKNIARSLVRHDVIVVTIQYRLSFLGFFCTGDENSVGNYGLWDQVFALRWVHKNIAKFGGDPNRITVFGQSAGAVSADLLSISPVSRNLVHQLILMGGNAEAIWAIAKKSNLIEYCRLKALQLGFRPRNVALSNSNMVAISKNDILWTFEENARLIDFLRQVPAKSFGLAQIAKKCTLSSEATMVGDRSVLNEVRIPITPVFDGELLPASIAQLRADAPPRHSIVGLSEFEGLLFLAIGLKKANRKFLNFCESRAFQILEDGCRKNLNSKIANNLLTLEKFRKYYGINEKSRYESQFVKRTCVDIVSDLVNNFALENYCRKMTENGSTVWRYVFEHFNPNSTRLLNAVMPFCGATHCTELVHLFDINIFVVPFRRTHLDRKVNALLTRYWTNFAKYGNPNICCSAGGKLDIEDGEQLDNSQNNIKANNVYINSDDARCNKKKYDEKKFNDEKYSMDSSFSDFDISLYNASLISDTSSSKIVTEPISIFEPKDSKSIEKVESSGKNIRHKKYCERSQNMPMRPKKTNGKILCEKGKEVLWLPVDSKKIHRYLAIRPIPEFRTENNNSIWRRARELAKFVDYTERYDI